MLRDRLASVDMVHVTSSAGKFHSSRLNRMVRTNGIARPGVGTASSQAIGTVALIMYSGCSYARKGMNTPLVIFAAW